MASTPLRRALHQAQQSNPSTPKSYASTSSSTTPGVPTPPLSLSETYPFDWEAARGEKPAPYGARNSPETGGPSRLGPRKSHSGSGETAARTRVHRKESWFKRLTQYPSHLWFELTMLPHNMPLPEPKALGRAVGVLCHVLTIFTGYMAAPIKADFNSFGDDWSDMHGEMRGGIPEGFAEEDSGFGLAWLVGWLLVIASFVNAFWVFTTFRTYTLMMRKKQNAINSPNAKFVKKDLGRRRDGDTPLMQQVLAILGRQLKLAWRLLIGSPPAKVDADDKQDSVQELAIWFPGDFELALLTIYSPIHSMLHSMLVRQYWPRWTIITASLTVLLHCLISFSTQLVKDTKTLSSEVMYEYNETFVYPKINVVRKDACVMTHEAEIVDYRPARQSLASQQDVPPRPRASFVPPKTFQQLQAEKLQESSSRSGRPRHTLGGLTTGGLLRH